MAQRLRTEVDLFRDCSLDEDGFALMSTTILLGILLAFSFVLLNSSINTRFVGNVFQQALSSEQLAEAGLHKALYCTKATSGTNCGGTYGTSYTGQSNITLGNGKFSVTVTGDSSTRTVTSVGTSVTGQTKTVKSDVTNLPPTTAMTVAAAVQAGSSGIGAANNVTITGDGDTVDTVTDSDVTSVGDITCSNGAKISGNVSVTRSGGKVDGCKITRNGYADILSNDTITLDAYYLTPITGIAGSTVSGTKHPNSATPSTVAMPNFDLSYWEGLAAAGTVYNGDLTTANNSSTTMNAEKIVGNLALGNGSTITLNGPLWVTGTITFGNNSVIKLDSTFGAASGVIIADGKITIDNNGNIQGSGTTGSVVIVVSTNTSVTDSSPAIYAKNNVTGAVLYAPNGEVHTNNGVSVPAVVGVKVVLDQNTAINSSGLNIFNAPVNVAASGNSQGWHIKTDTWREYK